MLLSFMAEEMCLCFNRDRVRLLVVFSLGSSLLVGKKRLVLSSQISPHPHFVRVSETLRLRFQIWKNVTFIFEYM